MFIDLCLVKDKSALLKQVDCFYHRVVALVADKLERQSLDD